MKRLHSYPASTRLAVATAIVIGFVLLLTPSQFVPIRKERVEVQELTWRTAVRLLEDYPVVVCTPLPARAARCVTETRVQVLDVVYLEGTHRDPVTFAPNFETSGAFQYNTREAVYTVHFSNGTSGAVTRDSWEHSFVIGTACDAYATVWAVVVYARCGIVQGR